MDGTGTTYAYDAAGKRKSVGCFNGTGATCDYDYLNRLTKVIINADTAGTATYTYALGLAGNRARVVEQQTGSLDRTVG